MFRPAIDRRSRRYGVALFLIVLVAGLLPTTTVLAADPVRPIERSPGQCQVGLLRTFVPSVEEICPEPVRLLASALPSGFQETIVWSGLTNPTTIRFAADGRIFVGEKSGLIKVFDNLTDSTPTTYTGLPTAVHDYWDRGLMGLALDPSLTGGGGPARPYIYVLYTYDHILGSAAPAPRWGDTCPTPPGVNTDGCVVSARLSRFTVSGSTISGPEVVLLEDWCQQYPSHSIGTLAFGPDGALYVSGGDGASFTVVDYGQLGGTLGGTPTPKNPCGDPPADAMTPPSAEGGALRSQDVRSGGGGGAQGYAAQVASDGAIGYWRLGETTGTAAADSAGSNPGIYRGSPTLGVAGAVVGNTAATLDGAAGGVSVADANALDLGDGPWSMEFWYKRAGPSSQGTVLAKGAGAAFVYLDYDGRVYAAVSGTGDAATAAAPDDVGVWHHLVVTKTAADVWKVFVDGVDATTAVASHSTVSNTSPAAIGASGWTGSLDEVALYPTALTAAKVQAHFLAASTPPGGGGSDPTSLDGAILRVDPLTGAAFAGNPFQSSSDPNTRRIIAYGLRNPFRFTVRPGTNELWVGDVGWGTWEEINKIPNMSDAVAENFGWPCYEGVGRMSGYDTANLTLCETLYAAGSGAITAPTFTYNHQAQVVAGETCPIGSSAIAGVAFYPETGGSFPAAYRGGLFFADNPRDCIWFIPKGTNGQPDPANRQAFAPGAANPVDIQIGPSGNLYYVDFDGGTIRRISPTNPNLSPTARIIATPTSGPPPLTVAFDGTTSTDPEGAALTYAWDLDGDGSYDDSTSATPSRVYTAAGPVTVGLEVKDPAGNPGTTTQVITVGSANAPPVPTIATPAAGATWGVGDPIPFSGSATDPEDGTLAPARLSWTVDLEHCPSNCHTHEIESFDGVASGSFFAPDHDYPSHLVLTLTATDSGGLSASVSRQLDPRTASLSFATAPTGLDLTVGSTTNAAPFSRTVIDDSLNSITAPSPQDLGGLRYQFASWSDGGAATHVVTAQPGGSYTATFNPISTDVSATKTGSRNGTVVTFTVTVAHVKGITAQSVVMTDILASQLAYTSASSTRGTCSRTGQTVTCSIGNLAAGQTAVITIVTNALQSSGSVSNTASVATSTLELPTANNSSTTSVNLGGAAGYAAQVASDGAIGYWRLGESSGTTAADSAGSNPGIYRGSPTLGVTGAVVGNTAATLAGAAGGVSVADANVLDRGDGPWSMELWYKRAGLSSQGTVLAKGTGAAFVYLDYDGKIYAAVSGTGDAASAAAPDDVGVWHHLVVTKTAADVWKIYVDGADATVAVASHSTVSTTSPLAIGASSWAGSLDEVALYPTALTAAKVLAHFQAAATP